MPSRRRGVPGAARRDAPLGATRILIDGRNVQRALERGAAAGSVPTATLVARLRAAFSLPTEVELILDGHPGPTPSGRLAPGFSVAFARGVSADRVIAERVVEAFRALGPVGSDSVLVVSDDREDCGGFFRERILAASVPPSPWVMPYEDQRRIWICRGARAPVREIWPRLKHYE
ncbi:MAG TPA: hypothetical protein VH880_06335 [Anaeromyxobacteraceae bacterium]